MKEEIFFSDKGLTSTSANNYANIAKEMQVSIENDLKDMQFYQTNIGLIGTGSNQVLDYATNVDENIDKTLEKINELKQLQAWLREAIKAKEALNKYYRRYDVETWCSENDIVYPSKPDMLKPLTEDEYISNMSVSERARYYNLETTCSTIGKYIHPDGVFARAREEMYEKMRNPRSTSGSGRDMVVFHYEVKEGTPRLVEEIFFKLQNKHRTAQKELNSMKFAMEEAISESTEKVNQENITRRNNYVAELETINLKFKAWQDEQLKKTSQLKIIIPKSLESIFNVVKEQAK